VQCWRMMSQSVGLGPTNDVVCVIEWVAADVRSNDAAIFSVFSRLFPVFFPLSLLPHFRCT